jgi:hypothetical protein
MNASSVSALWNFGGTMLLMKPNCECCNRDLPPDSQEVMICSFECTFCADCSVRLQGKCPNCGGNFERRPVRPADALRRHPATTERTFKPEGCR